MHHVITLYKRTIHQYLRQLKPVNNLPASIEGYHTRITPTQHGPQLDSERPSKHRLNMKFSRMPTPRLRSICAVETLHKFWGELLPESASESFTRSPLLSRTKAAECSKKKRIHATALRFSERTDGERGQQQRVKVGKRTGAFEEAG